MKNIRIQHELIGALSDFNVVQLLRLLQSSGATGCLALVRGDECVDLFVDDGRRLFARTSGTTLRVGDVLVRRGEVRPEAVELALAVQQDQPGARLGRMLVEGGALTEDQIREALLAVQRYILLRVLLWQDGNFCFRPGQRIEEEDVQLELDVDHLLVDVLTVAVEALDRPDAAQEAARRSRLEQRTRARLRRSA